MKRYTLFSAILCLCLCTEAQDLSFVNPNQQLVSLNPSFAGSNGKLRDQFSYRSQWPGISNTYNYYNNTLDAYLPRIKGGLALSAGSENQAEVIARKNIGLTYAQHFSFSNGKFKLIPSLQAVYVRSKFDASKLTFGQGIVQWSGGGSQFTTNNYADFNSGLLFCAGEKLFVGASVFHLLEPNAGFYSEELVERRYTYHASYYFNSGEKHLLQASARLVTQSHYSELNLGVQGIFWSHLIGGVGYGSSEHVYGTLGCRAKWFSLAYNYDLSVSKLAGNKAGSHEIHLSYNLRQKAAKDGIKTFEQF
jgi:type IX secretion system PorP/SprF family membrane protein